MKFNKWTLGLAALGVVSLASAARAEEKASPIMTALSFDHHQRLCGHLGAVELRHGQRLSPALQVWRCEQGGWFQLERDATQHR